MIEKILFQTFYFIFFLNSKIMFINELKKSIQQNTDHFTFFQIKNYTNLQTCLLSNTFCQKSLSLNSSFIHYIYIFSVTKNKYLKCLTYFSSWTVSFKTILGWFDFANCGSHNWNKIHFSNSTTAF